MTRRTVLAFVTALAIANLRGTIQAQISDQQSEQANQTKQPDNQQDPVKTEKQAKPEEETKPQEHTANAKSDASEAPATKKQIDQLLEAVKNASTTSSTEGEYVASITCFAAAKSCTPPAVYFNKPGVSLVKIVPAKIGSPLDVLVTATELGPARKPASVRGDGTKDAQVGIGQAYVQRHYTKAPDVIIIAIRKIGYREIVPDSAVTTATTPIIDFGLYARAPELQVILTPADGDPVTLSVQLRYHRWHVDVGGFLVFNTVVDHELVTHSEGDKVVVDKKRERDSLTPITGAAINIHPSASPTFGFQFGLATNGNRQPSYFAGGAYRLRGLGPKVVLTVAAGIGAVPTLRFRDVKVGDMRAPDDAALKGAVAYKLGPYLALTFGFSFGGEASIAAKPTSN